jgi:ribose 5-phosphate isomerase
LHLHGQDKARSAFRDPAIEDPKKLEAAINVIPGVIDNGLFIGMADKVIVATNDGIKILEKDAILRRVI